MWYVCRYMCMEAQGVFLDDSTLYIKAKSLTKPAA